MTVESRAVRASRSIRMSVNAVHPAGVGVITRRHRAGWAVAFSLVGLLAGAAVALATVLPTATNDDIAGPPTTAAPVVTTIPSEPGPPIIIPPVDGEERESQDADDAAELIMADGADGGFDDPSVPGGSWDDFASGIDWVVASTTTTTEPEEPTTTTTKPPSTSITASQYHGPEHDRRYDKVHGTAPPGTVLTTSSDYGSSEITVDTSGSYYLKIYFNDTLPADQQITWTTTLQDPGGTVLLTRTFNFTYTPNYTVTASQYYGPEHDQQTEKIYGTAPPRQRSVCHQPIRVGVHDCGWDR